LPTWHSAVSVLQNIGLPHLISVDVDDFSPVL